MEFQMETHFIKYLLCTLVKNLVDFLDDPLFPSLGAVDTH